MLKRIIKICLKKVQINRFLSLRGKHSIVIGLHRVKEGSDNPMDRRLEYITPFELTELIDYLFSLNYSFVSLADLMQTQNGKKIAFTFDDGFKDLYTTAFPILSKYGIPFSVFLTTSTLGGERLLWLHKLYILLDKIPAGERMGMLKKHGEAIPTHNSMNAILEDLIHCGDSASLQTLLSGLAQEVGLNEEEERKIARELYLTRSDLAEMTSCGLSVEAHGHEHWSLPALNRKETEKEIVACLELIHSSFGRKPVFYAPAFGKVNYYLHEIVREKGFFKICGTDSGLVMPEHTNFSIPRVMTTNVPDLSYVLMSLQLQDIASRLRGKYTQ